MDNLFDIPTLVVIGVAIIVLFRLRSVLGTRTGHERSPLERAKADLAKPQDVKTAKPDETPVPLRPRPLDVMTADHDNERRERKLATEIEQFSGGSEDVGTGLKAIVDADPAFSPKIFMEGAKQAYEMIVTGFATGDRKTLKNLLEKDVYDGFERAITEREAAGHKVEFTFVGLPKIEITDADYDKRNAHVTIRFNADVVSATRDKDGALIDGNADQVTTIADEWTFARNPKSRDPNWKLVATNQLA
jgi:predicted lipid-binding transport protein (Tim44 family)